MEVTPITAVNAFVLLMAWEPIPGNLIMPSIRRSICLLGSAIKNLGLFSKSPGDFKMETMDF